MKKYNSDNLYQKWVILDSLQLACVAWRFKQFELDCFGIKYDNLNQEGEKLTETARQQIQSTVLSLNIRGPEARDIPDCENKPKLIGPFDVCRRMPTAQRNDRRLSFVRHNNARQADQQHVLKISFLYLS